MEIVNWKIKLVALWIFQILNFTAFILMADSIATPPSAASEYASASIAFYFFLTSLLIWLTLTLSPSVSRWFCIVLGAFFVLVKGYWLVTSLTGHYSNPLLFTEIWGFLAALLIVWYGWKYPRLEALHNT